jgi:hypothetical protein
MKPDPSKVAGMRYGSYEKLNERGFVPEETRIEHGDILIGKVSPIQATEGSSKVFKDNSETYKSQVHGVVDRVYSDIYNTEGYEMKKIKTRSERIPTVGDKMCMPVDLFEVLTDKGWKKLDDITMKHKIATLVDGEKLVYEHPIDIYKFKYTGDIYKVRSELVDLDVTMDHQMYVKTRYSDKFELLPTSKVIGKRYRHKKNCASYGGEDIETINIDGNEVSYDAFLELLGIFIADGCVYENTLQIAGEKERKIIHLRDVCERLKVQLNSRKDKKTCLNTFGLGCNHTIKSKTLIEMFRPLSVGALNKYLPDYVWNLNMRQSRVLLESLISCDGSHTRQGSVHYYTSSKILANDVMKLTIHAGWSSIIAVLRKKGAPYDIITSKGSSHGTINADTLAVRITKTKNEPQMNHGHVKTQNGQSEEVYQYDGYVGCLEVPSHVFMIRQNNKNVWTGNCSRHGQL